MNAPLKDRLIIHLTYDPPPIPIRTCDWCAVDDNYDGPGSPIGFGLTPGDAVLALLDAMEMYE